MEDSVNWLQQLRERFSDLKFMWKMTLWVVFTIVVVVLIWTLPLDQRRWWFTLAVMIPLVGYALWYNIGLAYSFFQRRKEMAEERPTKPAPEEEQLALYDEAQAENIARNAAQQLENNNRQLQEERRAAEQRELEAHEQTRPPVPQPPLPPPVLNNGNRQWLAVAGGIAALLVVAILTGLVWNWGTGGEDKKAQTPPSPPPLTTPAVVCPVSSPCPDPDYDPNMTSQQYYMVRQKKQDQGWDDEHKFLRGQNDKLTSHIMTSDNDNRALVKELALAHADVSKNANSGLTTVATTAISGTRAPTARSSDDGVCTPYRSTKYYQGCLINNP